MFNGILVAIHISPQKGQPNIAIQEVRAVPGRGLEGDRYFEVNARRTGKHGPDREITLVAAETLEALAQEHGICLEPAETRRNLLTRGVPLNDLVGCAFQVGAVTLKGLRPCEPCSFLESQTQPGVLTGLVHRGGLRAQILTEGVIRRGDAITPLAEA
jgi:MOSC domain-containing protein YiiM